MIATAAVCFCILLPQETSPRSRGFSKGLPRVDQEASQARRIPGGTEQTFQGALFDLPKGWRCVANQGAVELVFPAFDATRGGDRYFLVHDPELVALDGAAITASIQEFMDSVQPGAVQIQAPQLQRFGELEGRLHCHAGIGANGKAVFVRVHAFRAGTAICALAAVGDAVSLTARNAEIQAILGSLRLANAAPGPARRGAQEPGFETTPPRQRAPIAGGTAHQFEGVVFQLPKSWTITTGAGYTALVPAGANPGGALEEGYFLTADPRVLELDVTAAEASVDQVVHGLRLGVQRVGPARQSRFGDLEGKVFLYRGEDLQGRKVEVRVYGFLGRGTACALTVLGYSDVLAKRAEEVQSILASMTLGKGPAPVPAPVPPQRRADHSELVGQWILMTNTSTYNGGSASSTQICLNANGTYTWSGTSSSSNPNGSVVGENREAGTWVATDDTLTLQPTGGRSRTHRLEKRNHPKNRQDPMIVLDGRAFVTAVQRPPWR